MTQLLILLLVVVAVLLALRALARLALRRLFSAPEVRREYADYQRRRAEEEATREVAEWFGATGLDEDTERELPRYLRREFGEFLDDPEGLKAADLHYLGAFEEEDARVHYWLIPARNGGSPAHAYVEVNGDNETFTGWGDRDPPPAASRAG